jgi:hypothetical protein
MITISISNFVRIGNLKNASADLEISLKNESEDNAANVSSKIGLVESDILEHIKTVQEEQLSVDTTQDTNNKTGVDKMTSNISLIQSNIDNVIEPTLVDFDGNFKSLEGAIEFNKSDIATVETSITQLSTQFNTQHDLLSDEIQKINDSQFSDKISTLQASQASQTKMNSNLVVGMNVNKQSIANNKVGLETVNKNFAELDNNFTTLSGQTLELANVVDDHDVIIQAL